MQYISRHRTILFSLLLMAFIFCPSFTAHAAPKQLPIPSENNHYYQNSTFPSGADPGIIKASDTYYIYTTGGGGHQACGQKTKDFRTFASFCTPLDNNGGFFDIWAPEIYRHNNKFYLFFTAFDGDNFSIRGATSNSPEGPFKDTFTLGGAYPYFVIDHTILFDDSGAYLYKKLNVNGGDGCAMGYCESVIFVERLSDDLRSVISDATIAVEQSSINYSGNLNYIGGHDSPIDGYNYWENGCIEAPSVIKRNGKYYLLYSVGHFEALTYAVGYAESGSPYGRFNKVTLGNHGSQSTAPLLHGLTRGGNWYGLDVDGTQGAYGTGHGYVLEVAEDEMYYVYHSRNYSDRKLNMDYMGIDSSGRLFINGPTATEKNPAPSGVNGVYRLSNQKYNVELDGEAHNELKDYININARRSGESIGKAPLVDVATFTGQTLKITTGVQRTVEDIWLFAGNQNLQGTAKVIINSKYEIDGYSLEGVSTKIQLPTDIEPARVITIIFSNPVSLSDVLLYTTAPSEQPDEVVDFSDIKEYESKCGEKGIESIFFGDDEGCYKYEDEGSGIPTLLKNSISGITIGIGVLGYLSIIIAGIMYIGARGDEERARKARKRLLQIVVGVAIYSVAWALIHFLLPGAE